jgi:hypothetical protein
MTEPDQFGGLVERILAVHEMLESMGVLHQFGGAIALAWYRNPRATIDIDVNITLPPERSAPVLGALELLGVTVAAEDRAVIESDGQARLDWGGALLDVFFATLPLHYEMADRVRIVGFAGTAIPILAPEDLVICKAVFDRPKDWVDIESMLAWGTAIERCAVLDWIETLLGADSAAYQRIDELLIRG